SAAWVRGSPASWRAGLTPREVADNPRKKPAPLHCDGRTNLGHERCYNAAVPYSAEFRCFNGCEGSWPVTRPIYRCPRCDGLLSVVHDMEALRDRSGAAWMKLFDDRYGKNLWPYGSGVWGKREWVMPSVPDDQIVSMY